jgi:glycosyltransferase involved in cell wall biosynthesis
MNNFILIAYTFPPAGGNSAAGSVRVGKFAQYLPEFGWTPFVVSADHGTFDLLDESLVFAPQTSVTRVHAPIPRFRGRGRVAPWLPSPGLLLSWTLRASRAASVLAQMHRPKLILASSPPSASFVAGYLTHRRTGLPLVLDYRDQWTLSPYRSGPTLYRKWDKWLEERVLLSSSLVIVSNSGRLSEHHAYWGDVSSKVIVIPNGYDGNDFKGVQPDRVAFQALMSEVVIRHVGAIYGPRAPMTRSLLNALNEYLRGRDEAPTVRLQFIGGVPGDVFKLDSARSHRLIIEHRRRVLHKEALALELGADVLLLLIGRHAQANAETSSKVFEYMASGRPILVGGESRLLRDLTAGLDRVFWVSDDPSPAIFADFFGWLTEHGKGVSCGQARVLLEQRYASYDRRNIARQLAVALDDL